MNSNLLLIGRDYWTGHEGSLRNIHVIFEIFGIFFFLELTRKKFKNFEFHTTENNLKNVRIKWDASFRWSLIRIPLEAVNVRRPSEWRTPLQNDVGDEFEILVTEMLVTSLPSFKIIKWGFSLVTSPICFQVCDLSKLKILPKESFATFTSHCIEMISSGFVVANQAYLKNG